MARAKVWNQRFGRGNYERRIGFPVCVERGRHTDDVGVDFLEASAIDRGFVPVATCDGNTLAGHMLNVAAPGVKFRRLLIVYIEAENR